MTQKPDPNSKWGFYILLSLLFIERIYNFVHFNLGLIDSDQPLFWEGAVEMLHGHFREPAVYGQSYNTFLESILAIPLLCLKVPVYIALPLVSNILILVSIVGLGFLTIKHNSFTMGWAVLGYFLLLPAEFMFITSMPRGFITGICCAVMGVVYIEKWNTRQPWPGGLLLGLSMILNPNAMLLLVPYIIIKIKGWYHSKQLLQLIGVQVITISVALGIKYFYLTHPYFVIHPPPALQYHPEYLQDLWTIKNAEKFFGLGPLLHYGGPTILIFLGLMCYRERHHNQWLFWGILTLLIMIPLLMGFDKIQDGEPSVFFPSSRMFLALPFVLGLIFVFMKPIPISKSMYLFANCFIIVWVAIKCFTITIRTERAGKENGNKVAIERFDDIIYKINQLNALGKQYHAENFIIGVRNDFYTYGIPALSNLRHKTVGAAYERRFWAFDAFNSAGSRQVIYVGNHLRSQYPDLKCRFLETCGVDSVYIINNESEKKQVDAIIQSIQLKRKNYIDCEKL